MHYFICSKIADTVHISKNQSTFLRFLFGVVYGVIILVLIFSCTKFGKSVYTSFTLFYSKFCTTFFQNSYLLKSINVSEIYRLKGLYTESKLLWDNHFSSTLTLSDRILWSPGNALCHFDLLIFTCQILPVKQFCTPCSSRQIHEKYQSIVNLTWAGYWMS